MKNFASILGFFSIITLNAQHIKPFLGTSILMNGEFTNSSVLNFNGGAEFKVTHFFKPEIEAGFYFGSAREITTDNNEGFTTSNYNKISKVFSVSFLPKFILNGNKTEDAEFGYLQIFPVYTISNINASGYYILVNQENLEASTEERESVSSIEHSIGIGFGINFHVSENNTNALAINLLYQPIDFGKNLEQLKYNTTQFTRKNQVGLGVKFYFGKKIKD